MAEPLSIGGGEFIEDPSTLLNQVEIVEVEEAEAEPRKSKDNGLEAQGSPLSLALPKESTKEACEEPRKSSQELPKVSPRTFAKQVLEMNSNILDKYDP